MTKTEKHNLARTLRVERICAQSDLERGKITKAEHAAKLATIKSIAISCAAWMAQTTEQADVTDWLQRTGVLK